MKTEDLIKSLRLVASLPVESELGENLQSLVLNPAIEALTFLDTRNKLQIEILEWIANKAGSLDQCQDAAERVLQDTNVVYCSICTGPFDLESEGGTQGYIGIIPVAFCPTCKVGVIECGQGYNYYEEELEEMNEQLQQQVTDLQAELQALIAPKQ